LQIIQEEQMAAQLSPIEAHERTVGQIFSDAYAFEVPAYQRPYAWEEDQVRELLADLLDAMDGKNTTGGMYFLGSIVLIKSPNNPQSRIIDGQQRLTTLTILLSILRDLTSDAEAQIDRRSYIFQKANADRGTSERFRLLLRNRDRPFFLKYIQEPGATNALPDSDSLEGSQYLIAANARYLHDQLEPVDENRRDALVAFIIQRCYLVVVAVPTSEAARRIFTVLNARGLDLTPTDILKANLLDRAGESAELDLAERWESVELAVGRDGMVELFGHIRMIYERDKPRLALETGFPKFVKPFDGKADQFVSDILEPIADAFTLLGETGLVQAQFGSEAARAARSLARIDNKDWVPPILLKLWKRKPGENKSVANFIVQLERLAYCLFVTRAGINERIARFAAVMNEFDPHHGQTAPTAGLALTEGEQADFLEALDGPLYLKSRVCKPVLQRLDEALSSGGASYDELVSIEHVLPQTVNDGSEWATLFPDEAQRSVWTHRLANLVFLTHRINTRASNWDFEKKKKEYFGSADGSSPFVITQGVLQTEKWTPEHLAARQLQLLEKLRAIWQLNPAQTKTEGSTGHGSGSWQFTDNKMIENKRDVIMRIFSQRHGIKLDKNGALYSSADGKWKAVCTISKRYEKGRPPYWYGYSEEWRDFLSKGEHTLLVLGCIDKEKAYAMPRGELEKVLGELHKTPDRHWHIVLGESDAGDLELLVPNGKRIQLKKFEFGQD
jgi:hypothetical protein